MSIKKRKNNVPGCQNRKRTSMFLAILFALTLVFVGRSTWAAIIYVDGGILEAGSCTSWGTACKTIQQAVDAANAGDEIWVKAGTYLNSWYLGIEMNKAVSIYGGFAGGETARAQRNWQTNVTIVDGQVNTAQGFNIYEDATVDGFTIQNCSSEGEGAGISVYNETKTLAITIANCTFTGNQSSFNSLPGDGGAIYSSDSWSSITNCIFSGNSADNGGGAINDSYNNAMTVTNCTFYNNTAGYYGGGIYADSAQITNCILWANSAPSGPQIGSGEGSIPVTFSDVQGGYAGLNNINSDPLFMNAGAGDFHLQAGSPCIDTGNNSAVPTGITVDRDGNPRIVDGNGDGTATVDMGAYEASACLTPGVPSAPSPGDGATSVHIVPINQTLTLSWASSTGANSYDVYFGTLPDPPTVGNVTGTSYSASGLNPNTIYYWKVVAKNTCGKFAEGPLWSLRTEAPYGSPFASALGSIDPDNDGDGIDDTFETSTFGTSPTKKTLFVRPKREITTPGPCQPGEYQYWPGFIQLFPDSKPGFADIPSFTRAGIEIVVIGPTCASPPCHTYSKFDNFNYDPAGDTTNYPTSCIKN